MGVREQPQEARFLITHLAGQLAEAGIDNPRRDANLILQMALHYDEPILMHHQVSLDDGAKARLDQLMAQRMKGMPISRLRGNREFYSLLFALNDDTLDPRPDSEILVEAAIAACGDKPWSIADFGTGSGCLLLATLAHCPNASGVGLDLAEQAVAMARENAASHGLSSRALFHISDWDSALDETMRFEMILSNPPYIAQGDEMSLAKEVRLYDPHLALFAGDKGLDAYQQIMGMIARRLTKTGICFLEIGQGQEEAVEHLGCEAGLIPEQRYKDLAGIIRVLKFRK